MEFHRLALPFSPKAKYGDFLFYSAFDSVFPSPFQSAYDLIPANRLINLIEFTIYPSCWSNLHHAAAFLEEGIFTQFPIEDMRVFNDRYGLNMFALAIMRDNVKIILEVMKGLSLMAQEYFDSICGILSLKDLIA